MGVGGGGGGGGRIRWYGESGLRGQWGNDMMERVEDDEGAHQMWKRWAR